MALIGNTIGLLYQIKGDTSDADKKLDAFTKKADANVNQLNTSALSLADAAAPLAALVVAATAAAAAVATVSRALWDVTVAAAEYGDAIDDATQKTGLHAETLTALKYAAEQSGSSLEGITNAVTKFSKTIGDAAAGSDEAAKKLTRLGLDPQEAINDLDGSLAKVFKRIADAQNPIVATKLATDAFGKSGADIIPVIKSFDGDMEGLIKTAKRLGLTLGDEETRKLGQFADTLDTVRAQADAVRREFGIALAPVLTRVLKGMSDWLARNKDAIAQWADRVARGVNWVIDSLAKIGKWVDEHPLLVRVITAIQTGGLSEAVRYAGGVLSSGAVYGAEGSVNQPAPNLADPEEAARQREDFLKKQRDIAERSASLDLKLAQQSFEGLQKSIDKQFESGGLSLQTYIQKSLDALNDYAPKARALMQAAFNISSQGLSGGELANAQKDFAIDSGEFEKAIQERVERLRAVIAQEGPKMTAALKADVERRTQIKQKALAEDIARNQRLYEDGKLTEEELTESIKDKRRELLEYQQQLDLELLASTKLTAEERIAIERQVAEREVEINDERLTRAKEFLEKMRELVTAGDRGGDPGEPGQNDGAEGEQARGWFERIFGNLDFGIEKMTTFGDVAKEIGGMVTDVFQQMGQAVGNMVQNWVLLGSSADMSMKKMTASILAGVAAQAATLAVFHVAMGIAALTPWGAALYGNPILHFKAAALGGSIAVATAVAGRAVAGDSFKQQTNQATGQTQSTNSPRSQGGAYSGQADGTITQGRNAPAGALANPTLTLKVDDKSGWFGRMFRLEWERDTDGFRTFVMNDMLKA